MNQAKSSKKSASISSSTRRGSKSSNSSKNETSPSAKTETSLPTKTETTFLTKAESTSSTKSETTSPTKSETTSPKSIAAKNEVSRKETVEITKTVTTESIESSVTKLNGEITESAEVKESTVVTETENIEPKVDSTQNDEKMEPLVFEGDESDPGLEKLSAESSYTEKDKNAGSPILNRSTTRRKMSKSIPTNGERDETSVEETKEIESDVKLSQPSSVVIEKLEITETIEINEVSETSNENIDLETNGYSKDIIEVDAESSTGSVSAELQNLKDTSSVKSTPDVSLSSLENISIAATYNGNNTTQNLDFTVQEDPNETPTDAHSPFIDQTRDLSYIKTLKVISARKTLKDLRHTSFQNLQKKYPDSPRIGKVQGQPRDQLKRKNDSYISDVQMDYSKRMRVDENNGNDSGILSYVSSPISMLKMKFAKSSTPIRPTSFEYENNRYSEDINPETESDANKATSWCSVQ